MIETERRWLVKDPVMAVLSATKRVPIVQHYLSVKPSIRVRMIDGSYVLTSKKRLDKQSVSEIELPLTAGEACELMNNRIGSPIEKTRLILPDHWILDVFHGLNKGLIIAEYELDGEDDEFPEDLPFWVGREITGVRKYSNSRLAIKPFSTWGKK